MDRKPHVAAGLYLGHINGPPTSRRPAHFQDIADALPRIEQNRMHKLDLGVDAISCDQTVDLVRSAAAALITGDPQDFELSNDVPKRDGAVVGMWVSGRPPLSFTQLHAV